MQVTEDTQLQRNVFHICSTLTFYSAVISHSYYAMFYMAKSYLAHKGITIKAPNEHKKVCDAFRSFVNSGELDVELWRVYEQNLIRADSLLHIFDVERKKRGSFTYQKLAQANKEPANQSLHNARFFLRHLYAVLGSTE